jgi:hypothetical protein
VLVDSAFLDVPVDISGSEVDGMYVCNRSRGSEKCPFSQNMELVAAVPMSDGLLEERNWTCNKSML